MQSSAAVKAGAPEQQHSLRPALLSSELNYTAELPLNAQYFGAGRKKSTHIHSKISLRGGSLGGGGDTRLCAFSPPPSTRPKESGEDAKMGDCRTSPRCQDKGRGRLGTILLIVRDAQSYMSEKFSTLYYIRGGEKRERKVLSFAWSNERGGFSKGISHSNQSRGG